MVAHQNRPVTGSHSAFECLGLQNARVRLSGTYIRDIVSSSVHVCVRMCERARLCSHF